MAIDFTKPDLALAYLVLGEFHVPGRFGDAVQRVFWCGPTSRTGSGLTTPDPTAGTEKGGRAFINWQGRLSGCSLDATLGNLKEHVQAMSDVSFNVAYGAIEDEEQINSRGLDISVLEGRWTNKPMRIWLYDMDSGDFQQIARGRWDRDPTNIRPGSFRCSAALQIIPPGAQWPMTKIPTQVPSNWTTDDSILPSPSSSVDYWFPNNSGSAGYVIADQHKGVHVGHVFGVHGLPDPHDSAAGTGQGIWREIGPYGQADFGGFGQIFAHVSPSDGCWVQEVYFVDNSGDVRNAEDITGHRIVTFENTDPNRGPIGTNVKFTVADTDQSATSVGAFSIGVGGKVFARIAGRGFALRPPGWNQNQSPWLGLVAVGSTAPDLIGSPRADVAEVFEDAFESIDLLGIPSTFGTTAIADFASQYPSMLRSFKQMCCAVPLELDTEPLDFAEVIGDLARTVPCDLVARFDPTVEEMRLFPIWRGPRPGQLADHTFTEADLTNSSVIPLTMLDDPDGTYNNSYTFEPPPHYLRGHTTGEAAITGLNAQVIDSQNLPVRAQTVANIPEQRYERFGAVRAEEEKGEHWIRWKPAYNYLQPGEHDGMKLAAFWIAEERQQKQKVITARHGFHGFRVQMGEVIAYNIEGVWDDLGMVRAMRYDLDAQTVEIRSYHVDVLGRTGRSPETAEVGTGDEENDRRDTTITVTFGTKSIVGLQGLG